MLDQLYSSPLSLLTDLYQLTMAYAYWKSGTAAKQAVFHLSFRSAPFEGGYAVACGLEAAIQYVQRMRFETEDLDYLAGLRGDDGQPLFERAFLDDLARLKWEIDIDAIPEGTVVFAHEPLVRVIGPILQCQLLETPLLNIINFQTLIATKAARVALAAEGQPVLEFGLRRAQGIDGGIAASRAAFVGGCAATSNLMAGKLFGIPVKGTHAHSWVMSFDDELESFRAYGAAQPGNSIFLVDTYDSLEGVRRAVQVGQEMRRLGHEMAGIRLDSGDLAYLSIEARKILDEGGFPKASIVASNDLDEHVITSLKLQGAKIDTWGVGTRLATAYDQPALGGVYKLSAIRDNPQSPWTFKLKLSQTQAKTSFPGVLQVRRYLRDGEFAGDCIYNEAQGIDDAPLMIDPADVTRRKRFDPDMAWEDLLVPVFRNGRCVYTSPDLRQIQRRTLDQLLHLHPGIKRLLNPHEYPVGLEERLHDLRQQLILEARQL